MLRRLALAVFGLATFNGAAFADESPKLRVESVGGSRLVGTLKAKMIAIQADFGRVEVDPAKLKSLTFAFDGDTIVTTSGSIIKGKIADDAFEIESEFGTIKLERSKLKSLTLATDAPADDPKPEHARPEAKPEPKPEPKEASDEDRATRPRPIPRFITQPSALKVTKISAGRPVPCGTPPIHFGPIRKSSESSMNLRPSKP